MNITDIELLYRTQQGDHSAFHEFVDRHAKHLYGVAYSLVGNAADAEDVVQETFAGAFKGISAFRRQASVKTWLLSILVRQAARLRRSGSHRTLPLHDQAGVEIDSASVSISGHSTEVDRRLDVAAVLQLLSPEHRHVLVLREFEQMSYEQIAQTLGLPPGTVESRLFRARQELKQKLKGYLPHEL